MNGSNKVVLSLSGGLDSTMLMMWWLARGMEVRAFSFDYGQKHQIELKKVKKNIKFLQSLGLPVTHQVINLKDVFSDSASSLHEGGEDIPHGNYADDNMKSTVVENRNVIFSAIVYGKALGWANKTGENVVISLGVHAGDHTIYPDCRPESVEMAKELFRISNWGSEKVTYETPFLNVDKGMVLQAGIDAMKDLKFNKAKIKRVLKNTHTCYDPDEEGRSCGLCGSCTERLEAFAKAGMMMDPVPYKDQEAAVAKYTELFEQFHPGKK